MSKTCETNVLFNRQDWHEVSAAYFLKSDHIFIESERQRSSEVLFPKYREACGIENLNAVSSAAMETAHDADTFDYLHVFTVWTPWQKQGLYLTIGTASDGAVGFITNTAAQSDTYKLRGRELNAPKQRTARSGDAHYNAQLLAKYLMNHLRDLIKLCIK